MEEIRDLDTFQQCRLCGIVGPHNLDILEDDSRSVDMLSGRIFRCVGIKVERNDGLTTKLCGQCSNKISDIMLFRKSCAATNIRLRNALRHEIDETLCGLDGMSGAAARTPIGSDGPSESILRSVSASHSPNNHDAEINRRLASRPDVSSAIELPEDQQCRTSLHPNNYPENANIEWSAVGAFASHYQEGAMSDSSESVSCVARRQSRSTIVSGGAESRTRFADRSSSEDERDSDIELVETNSQRSPTHERIVTVKEEPAANVKNVWKCKDEHFKIKCHGHKCKNLFKTQDAMLYHMEQYHARGIKTTFQCYLCGKGSTNKFVLRRHLNTVHSRHIRYQCPIRSCSQILTRKSSLATHINVLHNKTMFHCSKCPKKFHRKDDLKIHLESKRCRGSSHGCTRCGKRLAAKQSLQYHTKLKHTRRGLFKCPISTCSRTFASNVNLQVHINGIHTKETLYKCPKCPYGTYYKGNLKVHLASKHAE